MYASGVKARQAPVMTSLPNSKRPKLDTQAMSTRSSKSEVMTSNRTSAIPTTRTTALRAAANTKAAVKRNASNFKFTAPAASAFVNSQVLRSTKPSWESISTDTVTKSKLSIVAKQGSKHELANKLAPRRATPAIKPNGLPLAGSVVRSKPSSTHPNSCRSSMVNGRRQWNRSNTITSLHPSTTNNPYTNLKSSDNLETPQQSVEIGVQTQEHEILNPTLLVGDIKFLMPSKHILDEIEKLRKDFKTKQMLKATRKFDEHSERQGEHLNELKEFLEKSYVTKRKSKSRDSFQEDRSAMDQLFNRQMPNTESITDIKARIKRKEQELLNLFDKVENTARLITNNMN